MYSYETRVRYSEVDANSNLRLDALLNYMQDVAIDEGNHDSISLYELRERNLAWVVNSWQIDILRLPRYNENIKLVTNPYEFKGFIGYRNCMIYDGHGELLVRAASLWSLLDIENIKPVRVPEDIKARYQLGDPLEMEYKPRHIALAGEPKFLEPFLIRPTQIDTNHHVNNAEYVKMALEFKPAHFTPSQIRVEYKQAMYLGDEVRAVIYKNENLFQVSLKNQNDEVCSVVEFGVEI